MVSKVHSMSITGLEAEVVEIEVDIRPGLQKFQIVGLAGRAVQESRNRVSAALRNSGFKMPTRQITVNLAPANLIKNETFYDLAIAIGILLSSSQVKDISDKNLFWGELSLDGQLKSTYGALVVTDGAVKLGFDSLFLSKENSFEAGIVTGINVYGANNISEVVGHLKGHKIQATKIEEGSTKKMNAYIYDFNLVKGQQQAKRAMEIAAAGGHNILMTGTPGSGKTFLSRCLASILPDMTFEEKIDITKIHSVAGFLREPKLIETRPFRNPHHTSSHVALVGGGSKPRPGEISLAHRGILFLDEFNEFSNKSIEALRQPMEDRVVNISRAAGVMVFPANFMLVAAMNPCKCGYLGSNDRDCTCSSFDLEKYQRKISGPIIDRIDLQLNIQRVSRDDLLSKNRGESSSEIKQRVNKARQFQIKRLKSLDIVGIKTNATLSNTLIKKSVNLSRESLNLISKAVEKLKLSARAYFRTLKVARTIADLSNKEKVGAEEIAEALSYRLS